MNTFLLTAAMQQQGGGMGIFIMMGAVLVIFWLFMIRPQQKKQNKIKAFQNSLQEQKLSLLVVFMAPSNTSTSKTIQLT